MNRKQAIVEDFDGLKALSEKLKGEADVANGVWSRVLAVFLLFGIGAGISGAQPVLAILLGSMGGITLVWWIHDSGHDAYFTSKKSSKIWIEALGILFLGMPQIEYHYETHRRHHGATNVIGRDGALETGPVVWHRKMISDSRPGLGRWQGAFWLFFVLPLTWPILNLRCIQDLFERKSVGRIAFLSLRWLVCLWFFRSDLAFLVFPPLVTGFVLGLASSLNHFHMPMDDKPLAPFPENVFLTTQNLASRSHGMVWLTGGLNFHVEHHLFPTLPHSKLREMAPHVEAFARKHGLPYHVCDPAEAISRLWSRLQGVGAE